MTKLVVLLAEATSALFLASAAMADEINAADGRTVTIEQAGQSLHYSGGNDRVRVEIAPNYSEELGWSLKGAAGGYITDEIALGLIVEYGPDKREYLGNAGIQFNDALSLVGTVGLLQENYEYVAGEGKDAVNQMEYGASLKGAYEVGILSGFELNGYLTNADADSKNVETGDLYGIQLMADLGLTDTTHFKFGGGYEWLVWADGGNNDSFVFSAEGTQQLGDMLSINANVDLGASEYAYGGGFALDLSRDGLNTNRLALKYSYIDGRDGVVSDQRVELGWSYGFGAGPTQTASIETQDTRAVRPTADVAMVTPANNLLNDVMKRPVFLPQQVIARGKNRGLACTVIPNVTFEFGDNTGIYDWINIARNMFSSDQLRQIDGLTAQDIEVHYGDNPNHLVLYNPPYHPQLIFLTDDWEGTKLYFQFSSDTDPPQFQDVFKPGNFVQIRFNLPTGCLEVMDQYLEG